MLSSRFLWLSGSLPGIGGDCSSSALFALLGTELRKNRVYGHVVVFTCQ